MSRFADLRLKGLNRMQVYDICIASDERKLFNATGILSKEEADGINYMLRTLSNFGTLSGFDKFEALVTSHENLLHKESQLEFEVKDLKRSHKGFRAVAALRIFLIFAGKEK